MLRMTEEQFWKCSPRKLLALANVHIEVENAKAGEPSKNSNPKQKLAYIDQI